MSAERTRLGAGLVVGGWWGGPIARGDDAAKGRNQDTVTLAPPLTPKAFGKQGELVLTSELAFGGSYAIYAGSNGAANSLSIAPGVDYFVRDRISVGAFIYVGWSNSSGTGSTGTGTASASSDGIGFRLGVDLPFGQSISVYPRASLSCGDERSQELSFAYMNFDAGTSLTIAASLPLLVHVASHYFLGFGPSVAHDLSRSFNQGGSHQGTTVGASFLTGGWL